MMRTLQARVTRARHAWADERGAAIVEFAIIFPVLIILLFGMIDFGRAFFLRNTLLSGVREGARLGSIQQGIPCGSASVETAMKNRVIAASPNLGGRAMVAADITVTWPSSGTACASGQTTNARVSVTYPFTPITPVLRLLGFGSNPSLPITVFATYRWEGST